MDLPPRIFLNSYPYDPRYQAPFVPGYVAPYAPVYPNGVMMSNTWKDTTNE